MVIFLVFVWPRNSWCGFPQIHISISYLGNRLLQVILIIALHDCVTSWSYQDSLMCMVLNSNLLTYAFCEIDLGYLCNIPPGNYFQYNSLSLTIEIDVCGNFVNHLHLGFCFLLPFLFPRNCFFLLLSSLPLVDLFVLIDICGVLILSVCILYSKSNPK